MIWHIRERHVFERLTREGRRVRAGVLWCSFLHDPHVSPPGVAFALSRALGPSVVRNRIRRRLRAALTARSPGHRLPPGWYLIGARPEAATLSFAELDAQVTQLVGAVERQLASASARSSEP